jgi:hypothetical protein
LIGTLSVVLILGVLAMIAMSSTPSPVVPSNPNGHGVTVPNSPAGGASLAATMACKTDFVSLTLAIENYLTANGAKPPNGTSWATKSTTTGPLLQSWPSIAGFSFVWNGSQLSVIPKKGLPATANFGTSSPPTGCFAK